MDVYGFTHEDLEAARGAVESALSIRLDEAQEESSPGGFYFRWYVPDGPCVQAIPPGIRSMQGGRWRSFLFVAAGAHGIALLGCPMMDSREPLVVTVIICLIPILSSLFLVFRYRTVSERIIAYCSLVASLFWLAVAAGSIQHALKISVVRPQSPNQPAAANPAVTFCVTLFSGSAGSLVENVRHTCR